MALMRPAGIITLLTLAATAPPGAPACSRGEPPLWEKSALSDTPLFRIQIGGLTGYIDRSGRIAIRPRARSVEPTWFGDFFGGVAGADGLLEFSGRQLVLPRGHRLAGRCAEGLIAFYRCSGNKCRYGYLRCDGSLAIQARFDEAFAHSEGLAAVRVGERIGYIDRTGAMIVQPRFHWAGNFAEGLARVVEPGRCRFVDPDPCTISRGVREESGEADQLCPYSFVDSRGRRAFPAVFGRVEDFSEGLAAFSADVSPAKQANWGFIDRSGRVRIPPRFDEARSFHEGLAAVRIGHLWGYANQAGEVVIPPRFSDAKDFSDGAAVVSLHDGRALFIDTQGRRLFGQFFRFATPFRLGLAHVQDGVWNAWIDRRGRAVFRY